MKLKTINFSIRFPIFLGIQKEHNRKENQKGKKKKKKSVPIKLMSLICELIRNPKISHTMNEREWESDRVREKDKKNLIVKNTVEPI